MDPTFPQPPDTTDPTAVAVLCAELAAGMTQLSLSAMSGTAMGGPPNPAFYYGRVAGALDAAAKLLTTAQMATPVAPPQSPDTAVSGLLPPKQGGKPK